MLDSNLLWPICLQNAKLYERKHEVFVSPKERSPYKISSTEKGVIRIKRLSVANSYETISFVKFKKCIEQINKLYPNIPKTSLYEHVVEETTIVELLPILDWDGDKSNIIVTAQALQNNEQKNEEVKSGNYTQAVSRKGQQKLREKLLYLYSGKCAVTDCNIEISLNACHITPYVETQVCLSEDSILLRSDIHDLFDANLLAIHPENHIIHIHGNIQESEYCKLQGKKINDRIVEEPIKIQGLENRWLKFNSTKVKK